MGVYLGDRKKAIEALEFFLKALKGQEKQNDDDGDNIPF